MSDRLIERDYIKAKMFAENVDTNRLKDGVVTLSNLYYFWESMTKCGLSPDSKEHCELAKQSLEEKLKAARSEMIVRTSEGLLVSNKDDFKEFYFSECERVKSELIKIYKNNYLEHYKKFERLNQNKPSSESPLIFFKGRMLRIRMSVESFIHGIEIDKTILLGRIRFSIVECYYSGENRVKYYGNFNQCITKKYESNFQKATDATIIKKFYDEFKQFGALPEKIRICIINNEENVRSERERGIKEANYAREEILKRIIK